MKKLISMTAFVLEQRRKVINFEYPYNKENNDTEKFTFLYAEFLIQALNLGMFVPCDLDGNILKNVCTYDINLCTNSKCIEYKKAKERVLFEGFTFYKDDNESFSLDLINSDGSETFCFMKNETIEDLLTFDYEFNLTASAQKQIGL